MKDCFILKSRFQEIDIKGISILKEVMFYKEQTSNTVSSALKHTTKIEIYFLFYIKMVLHMEVICKHLGLQCLLLKLLKLFQDHKIFMPIINNVASIK